VLCIDQVVIHRPLTTEARARFQTLTCEVCGGRSGTGMPLSPSVSALHYQFHSISAQNSYSFTYCSYQGKWTRVKKVL